MWIGGICVYSVAAEDRVKHLMKLPTPGTWARYHATAMPEGEAEKSGTLLLKSLSAANVDGVPCRWLESEYSNDDEVRERRKFLIPELTIRMSEKPSDRMLRYLIRDGANPVAELPPENQGWLATEFLYFPGFLKSSKPVEDPRSVKHQSGTFEIPKAYAGTYRWWRNGRDPGTGTVYETEYRVWLHPELPVGFAHAQVHLKLLSAGTERRSWRLEYALQEFGDGARASIAEETAPQMTP